MACPHALGLCQAPGTGRKSQTPRRPLRRYRHGWQSLSGTALSQESSRLTATEINRRVFFRNYVPRRRRLNVTYGRAASW
jgi:hypothetical protein